MMSIQLVLLCIAGCRQNGCAHIRQEESKPAAKLKGERWTIDEIKFLKETLSEPVPEVAEVLNRTYYATVRARSNLKRGILKA
jgi:thymidine kinase